jgi:TRAP-type C4-dicarboxylate transport system substrate-binding protein
MIASRRRFAAGLGSFAIVGSIGLSKPACAQAQLRIRYSDALSPSAISRIAMRSFWDEATRRTAGRIAVEYVQHPEGDERPVLNQIGLGGIDSMLADYTGLPEFDSLYGAYLFRDVRHGLAAINGPLRARLNAVMEQRYRCVLLGVASVGSLGIQLRDPIASWSDLRNRRIRTVQLDAVISSVRGLQAEPVAMPIEATHGALRDGLIDGHVSANSLMLARRYHEVVRYWLQGDFGHAYDKIIIARRAWDRLSAQDQLLLSNLLTEWAARQWHEPIQERIRLNYETWRAVHGEASVIALNPAPARSILAPVTERMINGVFGAGAFRQIQDLPS